MMLSTRHRGRALGVVSAALLLVLLLASCADDRQAPLASHLVLITLDTTRADRIGAYGHEGAGTPWLDGLADRGALFERAYTTAPITLPAHVSLFTGRIPPRTGIHVNGQTGAANDAVFLAEHLSDHGFLSAAAIGGYPVSSRFPTGRGFELFDEVFADPRNPSGLERDAGLVVNAALSLARQRGDRRLFLWVHLFDAHDPYDPPEPFASRFSGDLYQGEIARMDSALSDLERGLSEILGDESVLFCVVGDHGEALGEHGEDTHGFFVYEATARVPLVIGGPGVPAGRRVKGPVSIVDLAPTFYRLLGVQAPDAFDGGLLLVDDPDFSSTGPVYIESELPFVNYGWSPLYAVTSGAHKLIDAPAQELYDVEHDPSETRNLIGTDEETRAALKDQLSAFRSEVLGHQGTVIDDKALRSLGYVGADPELAGSARDGLDDPKDRLDEYIAFTRASRALEEGRPQEALRLTEALLAMRETPGALLVRASALRMSGRLDEALALLDQLTADSEDPGARADLERSRILVGTQRFEEALTFLDRYLARAPRDAEALVLRGAAREFLGNASGAETDYRLALSINPLSRNASLRLAGLLVQTGRIDGAREQLEEHMKTFENDELAAGLLQAILD